jgi:hypothetical protein
MSLADEVATLREQVESLKRMVQQRPLWSVPSSRKPSSLVTRGRKVDHGFLVGQVVYQAWEDPDLVWQLGWGFAGLADLVTGNYATPAFGVVSSVLSDDDFEVTTDGVTDNLRIADTGVEVDEATLDPEHDIGLDLYLIDDVENPGQVTRFRTASGIRIATWLPDVGYVVRVSRESTATFAVVDLVFSSLGFSATTIPVVVDNGTDPVVAAVYTNAPEPEHLRLAICAYSETQSVVLRHGKIWKGGLESGITPAPKAGPRYLGTAGAMETKDAWVTHTLTKNAPMIRVGYYDGARGFFFDPRAEAGIQSAWDFNDGPGLGGGLEEGDGLFWDATTSRFKSTKPYLPKEAEGPSVIARIQPGEGEVVAFQATLSLGGLFLGADGNLIWKLVGPENMDPFPAYSVLANVTAAEAPAEHLEAPDGTVFGRVGSVMGFGSDPELGTAAAGGGYFKIHFAINKYFEFAADGSFKIFHSASLSLEVNAAGKVTLTYGSSNKVIIDPADIVGSSRELKIRELDVCDPTGLAKKIQLLCTAMYT